MDETTGHDVDALSFGSIQEAQVALARLMSVATATSERSAQLEHALESRIVIEQAKGMLAERHELDVDQAFMLMRRAARTNRVKLGELARRVVASRETPAEVAAALERV